MLASQTLLVFLRRTAGSTVRTTVVTKLFIKLIVQESETHKSTLLYELDLGALDGTDPRTERSQALSRPTHTVRHFETAPIRLVPTSAMLCVSNCAFAANITLFPSPPLPIPTTNPFLPVVAHFAQRTQSNHAFMTAEAVKLYAPSGHAVMFSMGAFRREESEAEQWQASCSEDDTLLKEAPKAGMSAVQVDLGAEDVKLRVTHEDLNYDNEDSDPDSLDADYEDDPTSDVASPVLPMALRPPISQSSSATSLIPSVPSDVATLCDFWFLALPEVLKARADEAGPAIEQIREGRTTKELSKIRAFRRAVDPDAIVLSALGLHTGLSRWRAIWSMDTHTPGRSLVNPESDMSYHQGTAFGAVAGYSGDDAVQALATALVADADNSLTHEVAAIADGDLLPALADGTGEGAFAAIGVDAAGDPLPVLADGGGEGPLLTGHNGAFEGLGHIADVRQDPALANATGRPERDISVAAPGRSTATLISKPACSKRKPVWRP
ncbi:hypothetical protein K523DRAFT_357726 [Schizophyllum commune Tattone D]|nr:hypothetical protein K523DRAFT_357726 [Schizophyllum commune Tattone D]